MTKQKFGLYRTLSFLNSFILVFQSVFPIFYALPAYAEESIATPTTEATTTPTDTPTPTIEPTTEVATAITPTDTLTPTPTETASPTIAETITPTLTPTETVSPTITTTPTDTPTPTIEPTTEVATAITPTDTLTPTPTPTVAPHDETLSATVLTNTEASSVQLVDLSTDINQSSATLATDKLDYAPTDTVIITGSGYIIGATYTLLITSPNEPAVHFETTITASDQGNIFYSYQLDGQYRPNYQAVIKDSTGNIVSSISFTDSPVWVCQNDAQGANDEPGQKDLSKMCRDSNSTDPVNITWDWDDKDPGGNTGGNTGDACSLFDTDGDGKANYSMCVTVDGNPSTYQGKVLYSCGDTKADRCSNPTVIPSGSVTSTCSANVQDTDPFPGPSNKGTDYPKDTVASCNINLSDVGGASSATLLDVCSYPSQQPNSDPSDCIIAATAADKGTITILKDLYPSNDLGRFNLQIDGENMITNVGDGGTTGSIEFATGNHTIGEVAYTGTNLANYAASISCANSQGSASNSGPLTVNLSKNEDITCTITNTLQIGTLVVHKDVRGPNGESLTDTSNTFQVSLDGGTGQNITDNGTVTFSDIPIGNHTITESTIATGYTLYGIATTANTSGNTNGLTVNVTTGTTDVYITNRQQPATITLIKEVDNTNGGSKQPSDFNLKIDGSTVTQNVAQTVSIGSAHTINEDSVTGYQFVSITGTGCPTQLGDSVTPVPGQNLTCTIKNASQYGHLAVTKVTSPADTSTEFSITAASNNGTIIGNASQTIVGGQTIDYLVTPGTYTISEADKSGWDNTGNTCIDKVVNTGLTTTCTITNTKRGHIIVSKVTNPTDTTTIFSITASGDGTITDNPTRTITGGSSQNFEVTPGNYSISEDSLTGWQKTADNCSELTVRAGQTVECSITNTKLGSISGTKYESQGNGTTIGTLESWIIKLFNGSVQIDSTTTNSSGNYSFGYLLPGDYSLTEDLSGGGWTQVFAPSTVTLSAGQNSTGNNFGNFHNVSISGQKYGDVNGNGVKDIGETGLPGWTINLKDTNNTLLDSTTTDADGNYTFSNLGPNTYRVRETDQPGWVRKSTNPSDITVQSGQDVTGINFGNQGQGTITIIKDAQPNSNQSFRFTGDLGEFTLTDDGSNQNNSITFSDTPAGTYTVTEPNQSGWDLSLISCEGNNNSDANTNNRNAIIKLAAGEDVTCTFTNGQHGSITGSKWQDNNADGSWNQDEPTIAAWTIFIDTNNNGSWDEGESKTTTKPDGSYSFDDLSKGDYIVCEEPQEGWHRSFPEESNCQTVSIKNYGDTTVDVNFGNYQDSTIVVKKNVVAPDGETNVADSSTSFDFSMTDQDDFSLTDEDGGESFSVKPGTYTVTESEDGNYDFVNCEAIYNGSSVGRNDGHSKIVTVDSGDSVTVTCVNKQKQGTISGYKWHDINGNHERDCSFSEEDERESCESKLADWAIFIDINGNGQLDTGEPSTTTDESGNYSFAVDPGTYTVCEVGQPGWTQTYPQNEKTNNCHTVTLSSNDQESGTSLNFGNQYNPPRLTIVKSNNVDPSNAGPGGSVEYTITIRVLDNAINNLVVTDLPPYGFKYRAFSYSVIKNTTNDITGSVTEPVYHSPGVWNLGNFSKDDVITLRYIADIDSGEDPGLYHDLVWAKGTSPNSSDTILAEAVVSDPSYLSDNFAGTKVNVDKDQTNSLSTTSTETRGQVLGASTDLPATGAHTAWPLLALFMIIVGSTNFYYQLKSKKYA